LDVPEDPFDITPVQNKITSKVYQKVDNRGHLVVYKEENGLPVKLQDLGSVKKRFENSILKTIEKPIRDIRQAHLNIEDLTVAEAAAYTLALAVSEGNLHAVSELLDRVLGRPKQVSESTNVNLTIDDLLLRASGVKTANTVELEAIDAIVEDVIPDGD